MDSDENKALAFKFLESLQNLLEGSLPAPLEMSEWITETVATSRKDPSREHLRGPEAAFLNGRVTPSLYRAIKEHGMLTDSEAKQALLNEYFRGIREFAEASPARGRRHPFKKLIGASPGAIYQQWTSPRESALTQSCPDLALRSPFPYTIVFEGKYFARGSTHVAERELVTNIYQAFFYRGLPPVPAKKTKVGWSYDYACLLAYDASPAGTLRAAWEAISPVIRKEFWDGANVYVMILRGTTSRPSPI